MPNYTVSAVISFLMRGGDAAEAANRRVEMLRGAYTGLSYAQALATRNSAFLDAAIQQAANNALAAGDKVQTLKGKVEDAVEGYAQAFEKADDAANKALSAATRQRQAAVLSQETATLRQEAAIRGREAEAEAHSAAQDAIATAEMAEKAALVDANAVAYAQKMSSIAATIASERREAADLQKAAAEAAKENAVASIQAAEQNQKAAESTMAAANTSQTAAAREFSQISVLQEVADARLNQAEIMQRAAERDAAAVGRFQALAETAAETAAQRRASADHMASVVAYTQDQVAAEEKAAQQAERTAAARQTAVDRVTLIADKSAAAAEQQMRSAEQAQAAVERQRIVASAQVTLAQSQYDAAIRAVEAADLQAEAASRAEALAKVEMEAAVQAEAAAAEAKAVAETVAQNAKELAAAFEEETAAVAKAWANAERLQAAADAKSVAAEQADLAAKKAVAAAEQSKLAADMEAANAARLMEVAEEANIAHQKIAGAAEDGALRAAAAAERGRQAAAIVNDVSNKLLGVGGAITFALGESIKASADFETVITRVANNSGMAAGDINELREKVRQMSAQSGASAADLAKAYMHIQNLGFAAKGTAGAYTVLQVAMRAAIATGSSVEDTANILAQAMREMNLPVQDAGIAMNLLYRGSQLGNTTMEDFVHSASRAIGMAGSLGLTMQDVAAIMADLTRHGFPSTSLAGTQFTNMLMRVINPTKQTRDEIKRLAEVTGVDLTNDFSLAFVKANGLTQVIEDVKRATNGNEDAIFRLIPAMRGSLGMLSLTEAGNKDYLYILNQLNDVLEGKSNPVLEGYNRAMETMAQQVKRLEAEFEVLWMGIGTNLAPMFQGLIGIVQKAVDWFMNLDPNVRSIGEQFLFAAGMITLFLGIGAKIATLTGIVAAASAITEAYAEAQAALAAGEGLVAAAQTAIGITAAAAIPPIGEMGAAIWGAVAPLLPVLIILALIIAVIAAAGYGVYLAWFPLKEMFAGLALRIWDAVEAMAHLTNSQGLLKTAEKRESELTDYMGQIEREKRANEEKSAAQEKMKKDAEKALEMMGSPEDFTKKSEDMAKAAAKDAEDKKLEQQTKATTEDLARAYYKNRYDFEMWKEDQLLQERLDAGVDADLAKQAHDEKINSLMKEREAARARGELRTPDEEADKMLAEATSQDRYQAQREELNQKLQQLLDEGVDPNKVAQIKAARNAQLDKEEAQYNALKQKQEDAAEAHQDNLEDQKEAFRLTHTRFQIQKQELDEQYMRGLSVAKTRQEAENVEKNYQEGLLALQKDEADYNQKQQDKLNRKDQALDDRALRDQMRLDYHDARFGVGSPDYPYPQGGPESYAPNYGPAGVPGGRGNYGFPGSHLLRVYHFYSDGSVDFDERVDRRILDAMSGLGGTTIPGAP